MTLKIYKNSYVDMSPSAITFRLKRLSQMRDLCISLKKAGQNMRKEKLLISSVT